MPAAFSRLQLAAALLEYDNDLDDPDAPRKSAQDSAIFAHLRRNPAARPGVTQRKSDYLGVSLPSETASLGGRESVVGTRRSRASRGSIDALRNPFGAEDAFEESEDGIPHEEEIEVDLTSWGLDAFIPKGKAKSSKGKDKHTYTSPTVASVPLHTPLTNRDMSSALPRRAFGSSRTMSLGGGLDFVNAQDSSPLAHAGPSDPRRRTVSSPLDLTGVEASASFPQRRRAGSEVMMKSNYEDSQSVPFPSSLIPGYTQPSNDLRPTHERTYSRATIGSRALVDEDQEDTRQRRQSSATVGTTIQNEDNPFVLDAPRHISKFDPKAAAHVRTMSNASMGTRMMLDNDQASVATRAPLERERRFSTTRDLLRPKVLVMPSPLQPISTVVTPPIDSTVRGGFQISTDGPPLPPGARSLRRASQSFTTLEGTPPTASNSFTPNPLLDLSLSQKTFRNTLMVGGQQDPYVDVDGMLPRATQEGEQIELDPVVQEMEIPLPVAPIEVDHTTPSRPAGKLYGKSLIDDLENRKAQMRAKQRVFTGDQRPSMMAREQTRSSTFIDPASLAVRPQSQRMSSFGPSSQPLTRRNSSNIKPLLNFEDDNKGLRAPQNLPGTRSVFGVDTLWEREMVKLRELQAQEQELEEARRIQEQEEERMRQEKMKKKKKKKGKQGDAPAPVIESEPAAIPDVARISVEPPVLPVIERAPRRAPRPVDDDDDDDEQSDSDGSDGLVLAHAAAEPAGWPGSSDDEDTGPRRTTGVGLRYPSKRGRKVAPPVGPDSDEDLPLAAVIRKPMKKEPWLQTQVDSDEEQPLSVILQKTKSKLSVRNDDEEDEDNEPLALRASRIPPSAHGGMDDDDDDDKPLALHPDQQRRTQYIMAQQQQHQQQQMMMQAQFQNGMFFGPPSVMGSGFFSNPMMNPMMMMQPPMSIPSPPPLHDEIKFGRVDRWRRDVVVEREP